PNLPHPFQRFSTGGEAAQQKFVPAEGGKAGDALKAKRSFCADCWLLHYKESRLKISRSSGFFCLWGKRQTGIR
ncbi:hypothetical protein, partial [Bilophila sp. 4_1_30]|uniref:hypothetical protein n=1 Tax=Bilophila sp. 4_1_30 TaxID=693988 RepID=UPI001E447700